MSLLVLGLALTSAPLPAAELDPSVDLLERSTELIVHAPTRTLAPGPELQGFFLQGLSLERKPPAAWLGRKASLQFYATGAEDLELRLRLRPLTAAGGLLVHASVQGLDLGRQEVRAGADVALKLPSSALAPGPNLVQLELEATSSPPPGEARWAVFERLEVLGQPEEGSSAPPEPAPTGAGARGSRSLGLAGGATLETWLPPGPVRRLELAGSCPGAGEGLRLILYDAGGGKIWREDIRCDPALRAGLDFPALTEPARFVLAVPSNRPVRLDELSLGPAAPLPPPRRLAQRDARPPNVVILCVDALRADLLGAYGSAEPITPHMDALERDSVVFANGFALSPWTRTSIATLLTGQQPYRHKANAGNKGLNPSLPTLAERLGRAGYRNEAIVTNGNLSEGFGFDRGYAKFDYFEEDVNRPGIHVRASVVVDEVLGRLERLRSAQPFHLYLHVTDPHFPYEPTEPFRSLYLRSRYAQPEIARDRRSLFQLAARKDFPPEALQLLRELYAAEVAYVDEELGRLIAGLKQAGLYDGTLILLTADHGEQFLEHGGLLHGYSFFGELIRVPYVLKLPHSEEAGRVVTDLASHLDIVPTVLGLAHAPADPGLPGVDLLQSLGGSSVRPPVGIYTYKRRPYFNEGAATERYTLILNYFRRGWRDDERRPLIELFDRIADPAERSNVADAHPGYVRYLVQRLEGLRRAVERDDKAEAPTVEVESELQEALEAVGYVD